jgi:ParB family transcriptional regulator, chromosome partitioning protein
MDAPLSQQVVFLPAEALRPNPHQPRRIFDSAALDMLAESVRQYGVLQPLTVRKISDGWEIIAGERRLRAAKQAGLTRVPCLIAQADDRESALLALVENLQREDLHYLEEASAIAAYIKRTGLSQEEAAAQMGRSPSAIANKLRLLRLSPDCAALLLKYGLSERHARALLRLDDESERLRILRHIAGAGLNVSQTEACIEKRLRFLEKTQPTGRRTYIIKDVRLFLNSMERGLKLIREAGIPAEGTREETEDSILLTIRIPKLPPAPGL